MAGISFLLAAAAVVACIVIQAGTAQAAIKTKWIDYKQGDTPLSGYLIYDDAVQGRRPAILMIHDRSDVPEMTKLIGIYDKDRPLMRERALAGLEVLKAQPMVDPAKIAAVGYCFGGTTGVELVETGAPLVGFISVHGAFNNFTAERAQNIKGRVLILHGAEDPVAPMEQVNALVSQLRAAKVNFELNLYSGSAHGFTHPQNPSEKRADEQYKVAMTRFFKEVLAN
jgi:dienelactone hydrolase